MSDARRGGSRIPTEGASAPIGATRPPAAAALDPEPETSAARAARRAGRRLSRRSDLERIASWSAPASARIEDRVAELLDRIRALFEAPRAVLLWEEEEEPWVYLARSTNGERLSERLPPGSFEPAVPAALGDSVFSCRAARADEPRVVVREESGALRRWRGRALHPELCRHLEIDSALAVRLRTATLHGLLLVLDRPGRGGGDLELAAEVSVHVARRLGELVGERARGFAPDGMEQERLARELHDGLVQVLGVAALELAAVQRELEPASPVWRRIGDVQQLLASELDELRSLLGRARAGAPPTALPTSLAPRLEELSRRLDLHWGVRVELRCSVEAGAIGGTLAREIYRLGHEALVNAARHGGASAATLEVVVAGSAVRVTVTDNGAGFPFPGRYEWEQLSTLKLGPVMLKQRVAALGGELAIESGAAGARLEITLPRPREES